MNTRRWRWPRTLGARLFPVLLAGIIVAHLLSFAVLFAERYISARQVMLGTLEQTWPHRWPSSTACPRRSGRNGCRA